jgi:hypothetical protein
VSSRHGLFFAFVLRVLLFFLELGLREQYPRVEEDLAVLRLDREREDAAGTLILDIGILEVNKSG